MQTVGKEKYKVKYYWWGYTAVVVLFSKASFPRGLHWPPFTSLKSAL